MPPRRLPRRLRLFAVSAVLAFALASAASAATEQPVPKFEGIGLPLAPRQTAPWTAPETTLPPAAAEAIASLFDEGLADPRGCDYRQIEVVTGSCWGGAGVSKTHGWVLPTKDQPAFAVCWSGLVYPLVSAGPAADLRADVEAMLKADQAQIDETRAQNDQSEKQREEQAKRQGQEYRRHDWPLRWDNFVADEAVNIDTARIRPLEAALLFRLGETALAEKVWSQWFGVKLQAQAQDPYVVIARDWTWALYDRTVCAHMRGDDHLALAGAELLAALQPVIEAKATPWKNAQRADRDGKPTPLLYFLDPLAGLLAEQRRRAAEPAYTPVLQDKNPPQGKERVAALTRDLELVSARQWSQPGGVNLTEDPIVQALIQSGDEAVEPLIDCLENDARLTRSVRFGRDFHPDRTILGVHEAAYAALANILNTSFFGVGSTGDSLTAHGQEGRREVAQQIRAYWRKNKGLSPEERWYQTLRDDQNPPDQWLQAGQNIVQDVDAQVTRSSMFFGGGWSGTPRRPGEIPAMRGESLRAKTDPSVTDLLLRRMAAFAAPMNQRPDTNLEQRTDFALLLAKWDGKNHLDALRSVSEALKARTSDSKKNIESPVERLLTLFQARIEAGDPDALADYARWLPTVPRNNLVFAARQLFDLLWQHPTELAAREAAETLFAREDSPWVPFLKNDGVWTRDVTFSPLVGLEAFRVELLRGLGDTTPVGVATRDARGNVSATMDRGWSSGNEACLDDPLAPPVGVAVPFRVCDLYAREISNVEGAPQCQLFWPEARRNEAVAACALLLRRYGDRFQYQPGDQNDFFRRARLHLPPLDHPATREDVEQGRAIFALEGERRVWKLPAFPTKASWPALKDNPKSHQEYDADRKIKMVIDYQTEGQVFQAEEVLTDGHWERFYGFVGPHQISKVPAAEIKLLPEVAASPAP